MPEKIVATEVDLDTLSMDELRNLANEELATPVVEEKEAPAQKRDSKGQFTTEEQEEVEVKAPTTFRREIDLGDGAGIQVFQADSVDALLDQLTEAQKNATRKIREQATKLREIEDSRKQEEEKFDADKEFVYSQEMMTQPTKAMKSMFKDMTGYDISEFKSVAERVTAWETAQRQQADAQQIAKDQEAASTDFIKDHPDYVANESNGKRLVKMVRMLESEDRAENKKSNYRDLLTKAYSELSESGLLELKSAEDVTTAKQDTTEAEGSRIAASEEVVSQQRRRASGLSARGRAAAPPKTSEPTEDELYNMPLAKLRDLADKSS